MVANGTESKVLKRILPLKGIKEKALLPQVAHFFNKTDFEECLVETTNFVQFANTSLKFSNLCRCNAFNMLRMSEVVQIQRCTEKSTNF